jgi:hypothetical protein
MCDDLPHNFFFSSSHFIYIHSKFPLIITSLLLKVNNHLLVASLLSRFAPSPENESLLFSETSANLCKTTLSQMPADSNVFRELDVLNVK